MPRSICINENVMGIERNLAFSNRERNAKNMTFYKGNKFGYAIVGGRVINHLRGLT
jgi:hypothetical protein